MNPNSKRVLAVAARVQLVQPCNKTLQHNAFRFQIRPLDSAKRQCTRLQSTAAASASRSPGETDPNPIYSSLTPIQSLSHTSRDTPEAGRKQWLPASCPGCGAMTQSLDSSEAGYYSKSRKAVKAYKQGISLPQDQSRTESEVPSSVDSNPESQEDATYSRLEEDVESRFTESNQIEIPICDRCHDLTYNNKGQSIAHPTIEALTDSIAESPFRRNHIYHVLDAVDFPMSLIPKIFRTLELAKPRTQNRRARTKITSKPTISFIITRSDLLGPSKEMVDRLMPYYQNVLRSALGRYGKDIRLGNVHLVSAKRGWWTKEIKDDIWERGGGNWMVGKVNVGKSNLFPVLFPKGSGDRAPIYAELQELSQEEKDEDRLATHGNFLEEDSLLPPAQPEVPFPSMPLVSHLPGTTASPIRLPFGNHKGELIDLPGLDRGNLEEHVRPENRLDLVMRNRPNVKQFIIKPGQSMILGGGLIRITPELDEDDRSTTLLAYPFIPIDAHVTSTEKAVEMESQERETGIKSIVADGATATLRSCGMYSLETDVTKTRAGPVLRAGVPIDRLPFRVYATDILIEGVGWVELVCQVRRQKQPEKLSKNVESSTFEFKPFSEQEAIMETEAPSSDNFMFPKVEIFSPHGKHIAKRPTLGAWSLWQRYKELRQGSTKHVRPRKSMKGADKREKLERRVRVDNSTS